MTTATRKTDGWIGVLVVLALSLAVPAIAADWEYGKQEDWHGLGDPKVQSPIALSVAGGTARLPGAYGAKAVANVEDNGHAFQLNYKDDGGGVVKFDGKSYILRQFHFHSLSEHAQDGYAGWTDENGKKHPGHYAMEVHFVHSDGSFRGDAKSAAKRTDLCVVGVFIKEGKENAALARLWDEVPDSKEKNSDLSFDKFDASTLMPTGGSYRTYTGSLTTPPLSSGVRWIVMDEPITASREQIEKLRHAMHHNTNRSLQELAGRTPAAAQSQERVPVSAKLGLQSGIQPGANGKNRIPLNRQVPAYTERHLLESPAIYLYVTFADKTTTDSHEYKMGFASNVVFDDVTGDPDDIIQVVYWPVDRKRPELGKFAAQLTSTGKRVGNATLKVTFRNAPGVTASVPVEVVSGGK